MVLGAMYPLSVEVAVQTSVMAKALNGSKKAASIPKKVSNFFIVYIIY